MWPADVLGPMWGDAPVEAPLAVEALWLAEGGGGGSACGGGGRAAPPCVPSAAGEGSASTKTLHGKGSQAAIL